MTSQEEYYHKLSLPPIPPLSPIKSPKPTTTRFLRYQEQHSERELRNIIEEIDSKEIQERLKHAMDKIVISWTEKHDKLVESLNVLEASKKRLEKQYEKSLRDAQIYRTRYDEQRKTSTHSNSSGKSSSSCSSSMRTSFSLADDLFKDSDDDDSNEFDLYSVLSDQESCTSPSFLMSPLSLKSPTSSSLNAVVAITASTAAAASTAATTPTTSDITSKITTEPTDILTFACGDGFWNTIARGKANKVEVDTLISNYIRRGGNPNVAKNSESVKNVKEGYGLIHAIIAVKNTSALQRIIEAGANIYVHPLTSKKEDLMTPLMLAAKVGYMNGVRLLIEQGGIALIHDSRGPYGEHALHAAVQSGSDELAGYILRLSENSLLDKPDNNGSTPLHYACITGKTRLITLFIRDCQCRPDPRDHKGETPLHLAVRNQRLKVVVKLIELGVSPNPYILKQVLTPLDLAKAGGLKAITEYLKRVGAKTTKEMEKQNKQLASSNSSTFSGESSTSNDSNSGPVNVRHFLQNKTSQILRSTFDL